MSLLNEYFELLVDVVSEFDGTLDKFLGDGLMAIWGAPVEDAAAAEKALRCAIEMQQTVSRLNSLRRLDGKLPIWTGIGIDKGQAVVGYTGSSRTMTYTAIGPSVNIASRLCAAARPGEILVSDVLWQAAPSIPLELAEVAQGTRRAPLALKGISHPVENWSIAVGDILAIPTAEREAELIDRGVIFDLAD